MTIEAEENTGFSAVHLDADELKNLPEVVALKPEPLPKEVLEKIQIAKAILREQRSQEAAS
jgi:hypothetical protein